MSIIVRPLAEPDAAAVAALHIETWRDTYRGLIPDARLDGLNLPASTERWQTSLKNPNPHEGLLNVGAFEDGVLLGIAGAGRPREDWGYESELWAINIPKRFQKRQVGKKLLLGCVDFAQSQGAKNMYLYCVIGNENAMQFYHHLGAVDTDRKKPAEGYQELALVWNDLAALRKILAR